MRVRVRVRVRSFFALYRKKKFFEKNESFFTPKKHANTSLLISTLPKQRNYAGFKTKKKACNS